jgi:recombination associated protein RdgC
MFKNALVYRIVRWEPQPLTAVEERLQSAPFVECGSSQSESAGWVPPRGERHGALVESVGGQWLLRLMVETRAVPGGAVKQRLETELDRVERETGRRPKGKRAKELKEDVVRELLPRAFPKRSSTLVWVDAAAQRVVLDTTGGKRADRIATLLIDALGGGLALAPLQTQLAPATAMSAWLRSKEPPAAFSLDRECELKQPDSEQATVRYARHALDIDEVAAHIEQGKRPTQVAMTWDGRMSFVLTESMTLKKLKRLDSTDEKGEGREAGFDGDVALATGDLGRLIPDLIEALEGEQPVAA